jgi:hypothetical protein
MPVRIAVAVDQDGSWSALGNCAYESGETLRMALDALPPESSALKHIVWVDVEVPLPVSGAKSAKSLLKRAKKRGRAPRQERPHG